MIRMFSVFLCKLTFSFYKISVNISKLKFRPLGMVIDISLVQELPDFPSRVSDAIPDQVVTEELVHHKLSKLNTTKAIGPDEIHPFILATLCQHLCRPLCLIYNQSLQSGQFPQDWKSANVTPVFKMVKETYLTTIALLV